MRDAKSNEYKYEYDLNGNRTKTTYPDGSFVSSEYDARDRVTSQTDQHGNVTTYVYDAADRLTGVTDALGNITSYEYDEIGDLISITDANGNVTKYSYDDLSRLTKVTNALGKTSEMTYDECGNILTSTDFGGKLTTYTYDSYDRLLSKETDDGITKFTYTSDGMLSTVTDNTGITKYTYNDLAGLSKIEYPNGSYISYSYDNASRLTEVKTSLGSTIYEYDKLDRLVRVVDRNGYATLYEYDENGNRSAVRYANGIVVSYKYDEVNRLISEKALDKQGGLVAQYEYTLGAAGERTKVKELDRTVEYTYDALYRLTGEKITAADGTVTEYTYAYDNVSNRILKTENGAETTYTYNALNQLTAETGVTYQYDDAGNLISVTSGTKSTLYAYNAANKMIRATVQEGNSVAVEEYEYDYAGNRTVKKSENDYTYYLNDVSSGLIQVLAELDSNGNEKCYYTRGTEIISQERNGAISYYLTDGHGSVRQLTDSTGAVTDTYVYDAWGNLISSTGNTENSYLYCGEQLDSTTGLYYLRARYMNPTTGTFITMDTYQGSIFDPTSLHKYLYANANPVMNVDPSGYFAMALQVEADHDAWAINVGRVLMSKIRNICIQSISAYIPSLIIASSGLAAFVAESPAFADLLSRIASGEVSLYSVQQEINEIIIKAQQFAEQVSDFVNKANNTSSSNGGASNIPPNDPNFWEKVNEAISKVSNRCKGLGKCDQFKNAFTRELDKRGISYEVIKVEPNHPNAGIFSDKYQGIIGETGYHYGVRVGDVVYDNLTTEGMNFTEWINDLGGSQYVHWH